MICWPAADLCFHPIWLVITLPKSCSEPDNARELYMSVSVSSTTKNRTPQLNEISACLQWGATVVRQRSVLVCVNTYRRVWLQRLWYVHVWRLCGLRMCDGCYNSDREGCDSDTARTFRRVCVSPEEERGFLSVAPKQTWYVLNEQQDVWFTLKPLCCAISESHVPTHRWQERSNVLLKFMIVCVWNIDHDNPVRRQLRYLCLFWPVLHPEHSLTQKDASLNE